MMRRSDHLSCPVGLYLDLTKPQVARVLTFVALHDLTCMCVCALTALLLCMPTCTISQAAVWDLALASEKDARRLVRIVAGQDVLVSDVLGAPSESGGHETCLSLTPSVSMCMYSSCTVWKTMGVCVVISCMQPTLVWRTLTADKCYSGVCC
jgi:hypothetical protein